MKKEFLICVNFDDPSLGSLDKDLVFEVECDA